MSLTGLADSADSLKRLLATDRETSECHAVRRSTTNPHRPPLREAASILGAAEAIGDRGKTSSRAHSPFIARHHRRLIGGCR
jgi:hypothetical protein